MSNYDNLKALINANIRTNGNQEITGAVLNYILRTMVSEIVMDLLGENGGFVSGAINYLTGEDVSSPKAIRSDHIIVNTDIIIDIRTTKTFNTIRYIKYLDGEYAGYEEYFVSGTHEKRTISKDNTFNSVRIRVDSLTDWSSSEITAAKYNAATTQAFVNILDSISDTPSRNDQLLRVSGIVKMFSKSNEEHFNGSVNKYMNLNGYSVGDTFVEQLNAASGYCYADFSVQPGDIVSLTTYGNSAYAKAYAVLDADNKILAITQGDQAGSILVMPDNASRLIANTNNVSGHPVFCTHVMGMITDSPSKFEQILQVSGIVKMLSKSNREHFNGSVNKYMNLNGYSAGDTYVNQISNATGYCYADFSVQPGDIVSLTTFGSTENAKAYAVLDADNRILEITQADQTEAILVMPENAARMIANTNNESGHPVNCTHVMGVLNDIPLLWLSSNVVYGEKVTCRGYNGNIYPLSKPLVPGDVIAEKLTPHQGINLYTDTEGGNRLHLTDADLPYTITMEYAYGSTGSLAGYPDFVIRLAGLKERVDTSIGMFSTYSKNYKIGNFDNEFMFDLMQVGQMSIERLGLYPNFNIPSEGAYLSTDIDFTGVRSDPVTDDQLVKASVPYLYIDGVKRGTIVLYDTDGTPFIYDKNGNKITIQ